jgi:FAD/FMN-containing dehydrogenase
MVRAITFVDGTGNITVTRNSNVGRGLAGGLGVLGVITEVTVQLKPGIGKVRSGSTGAKSDANFAQELMQLWVSC